MRWKDFEALVVGVAVAGGLIVLLFAASYFVGFFKEAPKKDAWDLERKRDKEERAAARLMYLDHCIRQQMSKNPTGNFRKIFGHCELAVNDEVKRDLEWLD